MGIDLHRRRSVIVRMSAELAGQTYSDLSKIARRFSPGQGRLVVASKDPNGGSGALGRSARAEQVVAELEARLAKVASENLRFKGKTVAVANYSASTGTVYVTRDDEIRFVSALGFRVLQMSSEVVEPNKVGRLDVDVLIWDLASEREERASSGLTHA